MNVPCSNRATVGYGPRPGGRLGDVEVPPRAFTLWLCNDCNSPLHVFTLSVQMAR